MLLGGTGGTVMQHPGPGRSWGLLAASLTLIVPGCGDRTPDRGSGTRKEVTMTLRMTSSAFDGGARIPRAYTGEGKDVSPPLSWGSLPDGVRELALICDDPDAPRSQPFVHWVLYGLPPDLPGLPEGGTGGGTEGRNDFGRTGYGGPMPPPGHGIHHYHFQLYALDTTLGLKPDATKTDLLAAMEGHVLAQGELVGTFER